MYIRITCNVSDLNYYCNQDKKVFTNKENTGDVELFSFLFYLPNAEVGISATYKSILGAFAKLRKATISFVTPIRLTVRMEQLESHWTDFREILYLSILRKSFREDSSFIKI